MHLIGGYIQCDGCDQAEYASDVLILFLAILVT